MQDSERLTSVYPGDPIALKDHSVKQIEDVFSEALTKLTGQELVVSLNNLEFISSHINRAQSSVTFDVKVNSIMKKTKTPF
jgi:hypothetical protein